MTPSRTRRARVTGSLPNVSPMKVARYLPSNYHVIGTDGDSILIEGEDNKGWTLDGYVLPRLASGLIFGKEVTA